MRRRELIIALGLAMAWPIAANAQPDCRTLRSQILLMQAEGIADKLAQFIKEMQGQVGWTTQLPSTGGSIEQRRFLEVADPAYRPSLNQRITQDINIKTQGVTRGERPTAPPVIPEKPIPPQLEILPDVDQDLDALLGPEPEEFEEVEQVADIVREALPAW